MLHLSLVAFPVVIYAPAQFSWENADLCEYLASHGYIVIAGSALGATSDLAGANVQARDIAFLLAYAHTLPNGYVGSCGRWLVIWWPAGPSRPPDRRRSLSLMGPCATTPASSNKQGTSTPTR